MAVIIATAVLHNMAIDMNDILDDDDIVIENDNVVGFVNNNEHIEDNAQDVRNIFITEHFTL